MAAQTSISASQIVSVTPRVITAGGTDLEIVGLLLTKSELVTADNPLSFTSASTVGAYFGLDSDEYIAASYYFNGYDNSFKKPAKLWFANGVADEALAGKVIGGTAASLSDLQSYTSASFSVRVDGAQVNVSGADFSAATSFSGIANILSEKISGVTVSYNSTLKSFIVTSTSTGSESYVSTFFATDDADAENDVIVALGLGASSGAVASYGSDAMSISAIMNNVTEITQNFVSFTTLYEATDEQVLALAKWASDSDNEYLYCPYTEDASNLSVNSTTSIAAQLAENDYDGTVLTYGDISHAMFVMGIGACIDWNRYNGLVTWAFKSQDGLAASISTDTEASNAKSNKVNFYGRYATRNDTYICYYQGAMIGGDYGFVDCYIGSLWLRNALQVSIMEGITSIGRVPYNESGYTTIRAWCMDPISRALNNGVIQTGVSLSESQKAQLYSEIGSDQSDALYSNGYYLMVADPGASARVNRESPTMGLWYCYGGAVHKIDLPVTVIE